MTAEELLQSLIEGKIVEAEQKEDGIIIRTYRPRTFREILEANLQPTDKSGTESFYEFYKKDKENGQELIRTKSMADKESDI